MAPMLKACLNGDRHAEDHPALPVTPAQLAMEGAGAVAAGALALHVHPRDETGRESLEPGPCAAALDALRATCPQVPVGLTTGAWIEPDRQRRMSLIRGWSILPDFASVNFSEEGADELARLLLDRGVAVEAGLASPADAVAFAASRVSGLCLRGLAEPQDADPAAAVATARAIDAVLDRTGSVVPRVHHGVGTATWAVTAEALSRGHGIRVGLEDTLSLPDGTPARDNADLVTEAVRMMRARGLEPTAP